MSQNTTTVSERQVANARARPPMSWSGTLVGPGENTTHYLHLSVSPCEQCNGPVIAGSMGTRQNDISQETDIRNVGAACIVCGFKPEIIPEPSVDQCFRPIEWKWIIKDPVLVAGSSVDSLAAELSQDADR
jgi:hypothetical protein